MTTIRSDHASVKPDVVDVSALAAELIGQALAHRSRRAAKTLLSHASMRATVIALADTAELADHDAPVAATLHVLIGAVQVHTDIKRWDVRAGEVMTIPASRHGLVAVGDTAVLLTVALN